ncbi:hypothetical protein MCAG_03322 [Micromonospora sp. ATCC 39149]|nr:hypothetical protein MCAG_03322 [Micromonospora sp. ATCC 39149]
MAGPQTGHERADVVQAEAHREQGPDLVYDPQLRLVVDAVAVGGAPLDLAVDVKATANPGCRGG